MPQNSRKPSKPRKKPSDRAVKYADRRAKVLTGELEHESKRETAQVVGYSQSTADHPVERIEGQQSYRALMDEVAPAQVLANTLKGGLEAMKTNMFGEECGPDWKTRGFYLKLAHEIRGDFVKKPEEGGTNVNILIQQMSFQLGWSEAK